MKKIVYIFLLLAIPLSLNAYAFTRTLSVGDEGMDVLELQKYLNVNPLTKVSDEGAGSPGNESSYFGEKTKQAVINLQNLNASKILFPNGLTFGTGFVGPSTLNFLNGNQNQTNETVLVKKLPIITSLTPELVVGEAKITILGENFSEENNKIIFGFEPAGNYENIKSTENGTKIELEFESTIQKIFDEKYSKLSKKGRARVVDQFPAVDTNVSVVTNEGQSNFKIIKFTLK